jgi:hypothetical protein
MRGQKVSVTMQIFIDDTHQTDFSAAAEGESGQQDDEGHDRTR